jgi:hypothetical protein
VSPSGATQDNDDLVKDLENWFEDHRQLCRLMTSASVQDQREVASGLDKLVASVDSGERLLSRLRRVAQLRESSRVGLQSAGGRIPLSGVNRFEDSNPQSQVQTGSAVGINKSSLISAGQNQANLGASYASLTSATTGENPRVLPSRTYLKKNNNPS